MSTIGKRGYMEDFYAIERMADGALCVVCDGHGGRSCAEFCVSAFVTFFARAEGSVPGRLLSALAETVATWDRATLGEAITTPEERRRHFATPRSEEDASGTTLLACFVGEHTIHILNLGDCRAGWCGLEVGTTRDHRPNLADLPDSPFPIYISDDDGVPRLNGVLAVGRGVGDNCQALTGCVSRQPDLYELQSERVSELFLGSDGVWDQLGRNWAVALRNPDRRINLMRNANDNATLIHIHR
jgi:serine/threonine protein phosphatase PrpC